MFPLSSRPVSPAALANAGKASWVSDEFDGQSIHMLQLVLGGTAFTKSMITSLQLKVGGKVVCDGITGTQLDQMNFHDTNLQDAAGYLSFYFGEPSANNDYGKHQGDLDLSVIKGKGGKNAAQLELNVTYAGATAPTLKVNADTDLPKASNKNMKGGEGALFRTLRHTVINTGAAVDQKQYQVDLGEHGNAGVYAEYWFHDGNMESLQIYKDSALAWDNLSIADMNAYNARYNHPAINNLYVYNAIVEHTPGKIISTTKGAQTPSGAINTNPTAPANFKHLLSTSADSSIDVWSKVLIPFKQL